MYYHVISHGATWRLITQSPEPLISRQHVIASLHSKNSSD